MSPAERVHGRAFSIVSRHGLALLVFFALLLALHLRPSSNGAATGPRTLVAILIEDWPPELVSFEGAPGAPGAPPIAMPRIARMARTGTVFTQARAPSTSTSATLASFLTGARPADHGLRSARMIGLQRLPSGLDTWPARLREQGFHTLGAISSRQLADSLTGLGRGFESFRDGSAGERGFAPAAPCRGPRETWQELRPELERRLAEGGPCFVLLQLCDPGVLLEPDRAGLALVAEHLADLAAKDPALDRMRRRLAAGEEAALEELSASVARRRGDPVRVRLERGLQAGRLAAFDEVVGELLDLLAEEGRLASARVLVAGTRGYGGDAAAERGAASPDALRVPCVLRAPGIAGRRVRSPLLLEDAFEDLLLPATEDGFRDRSAEVSAPSSDGWRFEAGPKGADLRIQVVATGAGLVSWEGEGDSRVRNDGRQAHALVGAEGARVLRTAARLPLVLAFGERCADDEDVAAFQPLAEERLHLGGHPLSGLAVPRLAAAGAALWESEEAGALPWRVDVQRGAGRTLRVLVPAIDSEGRPSPPGGPRTARVFLCVYPHERATAPLVVRGAARRLTPEALSGAAALEGTLPLELEVELPTEARLALAVECGGRFVPAGAMRHLGRRFQADALELYFPPWLPERLDWFGAADLAEGPFSAVGSRPASRTMSVARIPARPPDQGPLGLSVEDVRFLQRLPPYE